jgi:hypothetical protein
MLLHLCRAMSGLCMRDKLGRRVDVIQYIALKMRNIVFRRQDKTRQDKTRHIIPAMYLVAEILGQMLYIGEYA